MPATAESRPGQSHAPARPWDWLLCVCGKKLCKGWVGTAVLEVRTPATQLSVFCRNCKRERFLAVRQ